MHIALGSDHAGRLLRLHLIGFVQSLGHTVTDVGTHTQEPASYVDCAALVARAVKEGQCDVGILVCGTGLGVSIAANKVTGIRAALCSEPYSGQMARAHNDANVLCLGARVIGFGLAESILASFLTTPFTGGRHQDRLDALARLAEL
jgi:ribose 5-phosphate isomerase B